MAENLKWDGLELDQKRFLFVVAVELELQVNVKFALADEVDFLGP